MKHDHIEIDGKFYQECEVVMLPTKEESSIWESKHGRLHFNQANFNDPNECTNFHLYILSNEEIKEGDWFMDVTPINYGVIHKSIGFSKSKGYENWIKSDTGIIKEPFTQCKKIIATTDSSLKIENNIGNQGTVSFNPLPRPSNEFLKKYCELGGVDKVLVEYNIFKRTESSENYNDDLIIMNNEIVITTIDKDEDYDLTPKLKVAPDNTITIKKKEEKTYKRDELIGYVRLAMQSKGYTPEYEVLEFIKENNL